MTLQFQVLNETVSNNSKLQSKNNLVEIIISLNYQNLQKKFKLLQNEKSRNIRVEFTLRPD